jgi:hypothetical protein
MTPPYFLSVMQLLNGPSTFLLSVHTDSCSIPWSFPMCIKTNPCLSKKHSFHSVQFKMFDSFYHSKFLYLQMNGFKGFEAKLMFVEIVLPQTLK